MDTKYLSDEQKKQIKSKIDWEKYKTNARFVVNNFNVPRGRMKELLDLQNVIKGNKHE